MERNKVSTIYGSLTDYCAGDCYPYHMPGHKRQQIPDFLKDVYHLDITEIDGFDNLHQAEGIIQEAQQRANDLYDSLETYFLVNGSTSGILASIMAVTNKGDEILIARNCHKSVYHAAIMQELKVHYYYPPIVSEYDIFGSAEANDIAELLDEHQNCKAVVLTSPTYEGVISDIESIAKEVHKRGKVLIVDEAHGSHLVLEKEENRPVKDAITAGADLVIHSLHKTLPAMTQTALLHINSEGADKSKVKAYLSMIQTSSPSYIMMASIDSCITFVQRDGKKAYHKMKELYDNFLHNTRNCHFVKAGVIMSERIYEHDFGKIVISVKGTSMSGQELYDLFRERYHCQMEMAAGSYVLAMMTLMDTEAGWQRLSDAVLEMDAMLMEREKGVTGKQLLFDDICSLRPKVGCTASVAFHEAGFYVPLSESPGRMVAEFINLYPPGIPLLVPGEIVDEKMIRYIELCLQTGLHVQGVSADGCIKVIFEK